MRRNGFTLTLLLLSCLNSQAWGNSLELAQDGLGRVSIGRFSTNTHDHKSGNHKTELNSGDVLPFNTQVILKVVLTPEKSGSENSLPGLTFFDVCMPEHKHCMKLKPKIEALENKPGQWKISGVKLHMDGNWEVSMKFQGAGGKEWSLRKAVFIPMPGASGAKPASTVKDQARHH